MLLSLCLGNLNKHNKRKINMVVSSLMTLPHRFRKYSSVVQTAVTYEKHANVLCNAVI